MKKNQKSICEINHNRVKMWHLNGKIHREDGPAVEWSDGIKYWWLNDKNYTEEEYYKELFKMGKITKNELFIHLI